MSLHPKGGFYQISQLWEVGCADVALLLLQSLDNVNMVWEFINCVPLIGQSMIKFRLSTDIIGDLKVHNTLRKIIYMSYNGSGACYGDLSPQV